MTPEQRKEVEGLFTRYSDGVAAFLRACLRDAELAEEITARVFVTVVRKYPQCRTSPGGWLWRIVRNELASHFRRRRPAGPILGDPPDGGEAPHDRAMRREAHEEMFAALGRLPLDDQQVIYMKFFQDMPNTEIARATGLTASNVGVTVFRALRRLRAAIQGRDDQPANPQAGKVTS